MQLLECYGDDVYRLAMYYTGCYADAEDISQKVFLKAMTQCDVTRDEKAIKSWLLKVTANECRNLLRSSWRRKNMPFEAAEFLTGQDAELSPYLDLYAALARLKFRDKQVIWAYYFEEMSTNQIAKALSCPASTIRNRLARARKALGQALEPEV